MTQVKKQLGTQAEQLAARHLVQKGLKILAQNLKLKLGEIDLLAQDGDTIVLVEVKAKTGMLFGRPVEMVDSRKQHKLWQLAQAISLRYPGKSIRIDVVAVDWSADPPRVEHIVNAVSR